MMILMRNVAVLSVFALIVAGAAVMLHAEAEDSAIRVGPQVLIPNEQGIGRFVADFAFTDSAGTQGSLRQLAQTGPVVVAMFDPSCPVSRKFAPRLRELADHYTPRNVTFLFVGPLIRPDDEEARKDLTDLRMQHLRFIPDSEGDITAHLGANSTTEVFVLDRACTLQYRGAVDDQFGLGYALPEPRNEYLKPAIEAVLAGRAVHTPATTAPGCVLDFSDRSEAQQPEAQPITFHNRVSRIIQQNCQSCHRAGESAPFALDAYESVRRRRGMIRRVVAGGQMPPWFADEQFTPDGGWANEHVMSDADRRDLLDWIAAGCEEGDPADAPLAIDWPDEWKIGEPDVIYETPAFTVPASGTVDYIYAPVMTTLTEDRWVKAMEIRPTSPQVVHHVLVFAHWPLDHPRIDEQPDKRGLARGYFAGMVPGQGSVIYPDGLAKFLPKGTVLRFQIHYTPNGVATTDRIRLGLIFSDEKPKHEVQTYSVYRTKFAIPPGEPNYEVAGTVPVTKNLRLLSFTPHMHVRGKSYRYELIDPQGERTTLLNVPRYDFNWQLQYQLRKPMRIAAGSQIIGTAHFDNSENNPANPDPAATVRFGEQTWDEMMIGYFDYYHD